MLTTKEISSLLLFTPQGVNKWKKEKRPIITLLQKYFTKEDLEEFEETGAITRMEKVKSLKDMDDIFFEITHKIKVHRIDLILREFNRVGLNSRQTIEQEDYFSYFYEFLQNSNLEEWSTYVLRSFQNKKIKIEKVKLHLLDRVHRVSCVEFWFLCKGCDFGFQYFHEKLALELEVFIH